MAEDATPELMFNDIGEMTLLELSKATETNHWLNIYRNNYWSLTCYKKGVVQELFWYKKELIGFDSLFNENPQEHSREGFFVRNPHWKNTRHRISEIAARFQSKFNHSQMLKSVMTSTRPYYLCSKLIDLPQTYYDSQT